MMTLTRLISTKLRCANPTQYPADPDPRFGKVCEVDRGQKKEVLLALKGKSPRAKLPTAPSAEVDPISRMRRVEPLPLPPSGGGRVGEVPGVAEEKTKS